MNLNCELHIKSYHKLDEPKFRLYFDDELLTEKPIMTNAYRDEWDNLLFKLEVDAGMHELKLVKLNNGDIIIMKYIVNDIIKYDREELLLQDSWTYRINI